MNRSSQAARRAGVQPTRKARAASRRAFQELVLRLSTRAGNWPLTGVNEGGTEALREPGSIARVAR